MRAWLPVEWSTACDTLRAMGQVSGSGWGRWLRLAATFFVPFLIGAVPAMFFMPALAAAHTSVSMAVMTAVVAFGGLLVGFVVTLMLFTGRLDDTAALSIEQVDAYVCRLKFLLVSQAMTLVSALALALLAVAWMILYAVGAPVVAMLIMGSLLSGFCVVSVIRMALLPLQIFELHEAHLDDKRAAKIEETNQRYRAQ